MPSLTCFHVSWFPHTAVRVYPLPWDLPSTMESTLYRGIYPLPWNLPSTVESTLYSRIYPLPWNLPSTVGIYPLPSTVGSALFFPSSGEGTSISDIHVCVELYVNRRTGQKPIQGNYRRYIKCDGGRFLLCQRQKTNV